MTLQVRTSFPLVDEILGAYSPRLGRAAVPYRNHVCRMLNYHAALAPETALPDHAMVAAAFHDLGIWTHDTFDYLDPSRGLAAYLHAHGLGEYAAEVDALILEHHKLTRYPGPGPASIEAFRRADLADVSFGVVRGQVPGDFARSVMQAFPNAGFHVTLLGLAWKQFLREPLRPMPMLRW